MSKLTPDEALMPALHAMAQHDILSDLHRTRLQQNKVAETGLDSKSLKTGRPGSVCPTGFGDCALRKYSAFLRLNLHSAVRPARIQHHGPKTETSK